MSQPYETALIIEDDVNWDIHLRRVSRHHTYPIPMRTLLVTVTTYVREESLEKCPFPRKRRNTWWRRRRRGEGGRVTMSGRPDGSTRKRKVQVEVEEEKQKRGQRGGGGNAVRSHIGSDTSNPEAATPQILPSCWTSCSLHNRIRMNRPSPARLLLLFSPLSSFSVLPLVYTLPAPLGSPHPSLLFLPFPSILTLFRLSFHPSPSSLFRLQISLLPTTTLFVSLFRGNARLAQRMPLSILPSRSR